MKNQFNKVRPVIDADGKIYLTVAALAQKSGFATSTVYCRARDRVMGLRFATCEEALAAFPDINFKEPKKTIEAFKHVSDSRVSSGAVYVQVGKHISIPVIYKGRFYSSVRNLGTELGTASKNIARNIRRAIKKGVGGDTRFATADEIRANLPGSEIKSAWPSKKASPPPPMNVQTEIIRSQALFLAFAWPDGEVTIKRPGWSRTYESIAKVPPELMEACKPEFV